jgi:hypothetical protein
MYKRPRQPFLSWIKYMGLALFAFVVMQIGWRLAAWAIPSLLVMIMWDWRIFIRYGDVPYQQAVWVGIIAVLTCVVILFVEEELIWLVLILTLFIRGWLVGQDRDN